eukprot:11393428-Alexandrium_andersonii.AAC.1
MRRRAPCGPSLSSAPRAPSPARAFLGAVRAGWASGSFGAVNGGGAPLSPRALGWVLTRGSRRG